MTTLRRINQGRSTQPQSFGGHQHAAARRRTDEPRRTGQTDRTDQGDHVPAGFHACRQRRRARGTPSVQSSYGRLSTPLLIVGGRYCGIGLQVNTDGYGTIVLDLDGTVVAERWVDADMSDVDADDIFSELNACHLSRNGCWPTADTP